MIFCRSFRKGGNLAKLETVEILETFNGKIENFQSNFEADNFARFA